MIYVLGATAKILEVTPEQLLSEGQWQRPVISVKHLAMTIMERYTKLKQIVTGTEDSQDNTLRYSKDLLTLALTWYHHRDLTREGDGMRFLQFAPILLHFFRQSTSMNYAKELAIFQLQYHYLFSDRMRNQLLYSRYVNTHASGGRNVPCDLHMEHLNR